VSNASGRRNENDAGGGSGGTQGLDLGGLLERTRTQLLATAKQLGLTGVSKLNKEALAERILRAQGRAPGAASQAKAAPAKTAAKPPPAKAAPAASPPSVKAAPAAKEPRMPAAPVAPKPPPALEHPGAATPVAAATDAPRGEGEVREPAESEEGEVQAGEESEPAATAKLDLGPAASAAEKPSATIPWSYGQDRVTAMAVDPLKLFVYWEVTDPAIERARAQLGAGGAGAWLSLRVYDTSGRIFDGTNARSYFDHHLERHDRQWFFHIGKPSSTAYVDIGLKSHEGYFARISRSGRVDFPRADAVPEADAEWLTVRVATGERWHAGRTAPHHAPRPAGHGQGHAAIPVMEPAPGDGEGGGEIRLWQLLHGNWERIEWQQLLGGTGWYELEGRTEWEGPLTLTSWEAGPFTYPVSVEPPSREEWEGRSFAFRVGDVTHVVYGPWQVVIRNLGAYREHAEVARWEVYRSWVASGGREVRGVHLMRPGAGVRVGASEARLGASERRWIAGSELRLGGASEVWRLGASEIRMRGASETLYAGASQLIFRGASERRLGGASEVRLAGGSERRLGGGSESRLGGASESRLGGGSEARLGGSEGRLGASEQRLGAGPPGDAGASLPYPKVEE
jgi:hypothetical protein